MEQQEDLEALLEKAWWAGRDPDKELSFILVELWVREDHARTLREREKQLGHPDYQSRVLQDLADAEAEYKRALNGFLRKHAPLFEHDEEYEAAFARYLDDYARYEGHPPRAVMNRRSGLGRPTLTPDELKKRFERVRKVEALREEKDITLEQACARLGVPYSTFRDWRRRMRSDE